MAIKPFETQDGIRIQPGDDILDSTGTSAFTGGSGSTGDQNIWIQTFESDAPQTDFPGSANSVEYDADGNVIALFVHQTPGDTYTSVAKFTSTGTKLWQVRYGDTTGTDGWGLAVDTGVIYVTGRLIGAYDKTTVTQLSLTDGTINWSKIYDFGYASTNGVIDAYDGDAIFVGYANSATDRQVTVVKLSGTDGSIIWAKGLDGQGDDEAYGMAVGSSGEVVVIGYMSQLGLGSTNAAATAVAVPSSNPNWTTQYNGGTGLNISVTGDVVLDIIITDGVPAITVRNDSAGNRTIGDTLVVISGDVFGGVNGVDDMVINVASVSANPGGQDDRMLVVKYNSDGTVAWQKAVLYDATYNCSGADADIDTAGNIYVCGQYEKDSGQGGQDTAMSLVKFDSSGVAQWSRRVVGDCATWGTSIVVGPDDRLYLLGIAGNNATSDFSMVIAKYQENGQVDWQRLLDNTTTWSFAGAFYLGPGGGGSSIAIKNGYLAVGGGFSDPIGNNPPHAMVAQIDTSGTKFTVGDWDFKQASFSGFLNTEASDITVDNALKTSSDISSGITVTTFNPDFDSTTEFLVPTIYRIGDNGTITFSGNNIRGDGSAEDAFAFGRMSLIPNNGISFTDNGQYIDIYPTTNNDAPHIHIAAGKNAVAGQGDLILGDDNYHVDVNHSGQIKIRAFDSDTSLSYDWQFNNDGSLASPSGSWTKTTNNNLANSVLTQVVWTSTNNYISGAKLTIQVEADETGGSGQWETQVCEAIIAVRGWTNASQPVMSVYGVTHTSVAPLMTFTVQRNPSTSLIEIVGTRTGTASPNGNASLRIYSVETGTND